MADAHNRHSCHSTCEGYLFVFPHACNSGRLGDAIQLLSPVLHCSTVWRVCCSLAVQRDSAAGMQLCLLRMPAVVMQSAV